MTNSISSPTEEVIDFACSYNEEANSMCMRPHLEQGDDKKFIPQVQHQEFMEARCAKNLAPDHWTNCMRRKQQTTCTGTAWEEMARDLSNSSLFWSSDSFWHLMKDPLPIIEVVLKSISDSGLLRLLIVCVQGLLHCISTRTSEYILKFFLF